MEPRCLRELALADTELVNAGFNAVGNLGAQRTQLPPRPPAHAPHHLFSQCSATPGGQCHQLLPRGRVTWARGPTWGTGRQL